MWRLLKRHGWSWQQPARLDEVPPDESSEPVSDDVPPCCGASIDTEWWADLLEAHVDDGFTTLAVVVPWCGASTALDVLDYDWPCGFGRFEIAVWNPERALFSDEELTIIGTHSDIQCSKSGPTSDVHQPPTPASAAPAATGLAGAVAGCPGGSEHDARPARPSRPPALTVHEVA